MRQKDYVKRGDKIYALVTYRDSNNNRKQLWRKADSITEAREIASDLREQLKKGTESFEHRLTLGEYLDKWLTSIKGKSFDNSKVCEKTYEGYEYLIRLHIKPKLGKKELSKIRPLDIQGMLDSMTLSPKTIRETNMVLSRALKQAIKWKLLITNPARDVDLPRKVKREMQYLSREQANLFLETAQQDKYSLLFELAILSGMRPEEYLALQWTDVDPYESTVKVQRVLFRRKKGGGWYFKEPKTPQSRRTIPVPQYFMQELAEYKRLQLETRLKAGSKWQPHNLVFSTEVGSPLSIRNLERRSFKPILVKAELPDIRLYDLRHTCATLLLTAGENPKVVSERLGHSSIVLTLDTYSHVLPSMQRGASDKLEGMLRRR